MKYIDISSNVVNWKAKWIWQEEEGPENTWMCFRKTIILEEIPERAMAHIAVDSKYWLWINGNIIVREGGVKRGPTPKDTYYDSIEISNFLNKGKNTFALLVWYWGGEGSASYNSSGQGGLLFQLDIDENNLISDDTWKIKVHPSFLQSQVVLFNRQPILCERTINYNGAEALESFSYSDYDDSEWSNSTEKGTVLCAPWNGLVERTIPLWKESELIEYKNNKELPKGKIIEQQRIRALLPANLQVYPYIKIKAPKGLKIKVRAEKDWNTTTYETRKGLQEFEIPSWGNGEYVEYVFPKGIEVIELKYRETGYDVDLDGLFQCDDDGLNKLWRKSVRTVYLNMRDTYMDCPDRERSQWPADTENMLESAFYAFDSKADLLTKKFFYELINWRTNDGIIWGAVPTGRFIGSYREFCAQTLWVLGIGLKEYYMQTDDAKTMLELYPYIENYLLKHWKVDSLELVEHRGSFEVSFESGTQNWYDWGAKIQDKRLLDNCWYYISLKTLLVIANKYSGKKAIDEIKRRIEIIESRFNGLFWNGNGFKSPGYVGMYDDRGNALAVYAGIVSEEKWPVLRELFNQSLFSSIGMERFVIEALYIMGYARDAVHRIKFRFSRELTSNNTALPEHFGENSNHGWGGWMTIIAGKYIAGITPKVAGFNSFSIIPQLGDLTKLNTILPTIKGKISLELEVKSEKTVMKVIVPQGTTACIGIPYRSEDMASKGYSSIEVNDTIMWNNMNEISKLPNIEFAYDNKKHIIFNVSAGEWIFTASI